MLNEQNKLYSSLYSNKETEDNLNVHLVNKFFPDDAEIPKWKLKKESCEGMISEEECVKAIKRRMENHQELMVFQSNFTKYCGKTLTNW